MKIALSLLVALCATMACSWILDTPPDTTTGRLAVFLVQEGAYLVDGKRVGPDELESLVHLESAARGINVVVCPHSSKQDFDATFVLFERAGVSDLSWAPEVTGDARCTYPLQASD